MSWMKSVKEMRIKTGPDSGHILKVEPIVLMERIKCSHNLFLLFFKFDALFIYFCIFLPQNFPTIETRVADN